MQPSISPAESRRAAFQWRTLLVFLAFFAIIVLYQRLEGAYESEFGSHPDEAAHYVTGLMIRDYLAGGLHGSPIAFANNYYRHYPKVALGNWPPVFYLAQGGWMLVAGPGRESELILMAALAALLATLLFNSLLEEFGAVMAATGTLLFVSLPLIQKYSGMIMAEILTAILMFAAALYLGRFLDRERAGDAIGFGICAALSILTKGTGGALAPAVPLAVLFTRKFRVLKRPFLWVAALIVLVLAGPWTWMFREQCKSGWEEPGITWHYTRQALVYFPWKFLVTLGIVLSALALAGMVRMLVKPPANPGKWAALAALAISVYVFQSIVPASQEVRHLLPTVPGLILFTMAGLEGLTGWLKKRAPALASGRPLSCLVLTALFFLAGPVPGREKIWFGSVGEHAGLSPFQIGWKGYSGFGPVAGRLLADPANRDAAFLISSDSRGEGMFVSEIAMRDARRPGHVVLRASKLLASSAWNGSDYRQKFAAGELMLKALLESPARLVFIDPAMPNPRAHNLLLRETVEKNPRFFQPVDFFAIEREGVEQPELVRVYRVTRGGSKEPVEKL